MSTPPGSSPFRTVGIVGCGTIGGSLALAARSVPGVTAVVVTDRDPDVRAEAAARGVGDVAEDAAAVAERADLVVLAIPVSDIPTVARDLLPALRIGAVLSDVGSVKARLVAAIEGTIREIRREGEVAFMGGHPMAGSEIGGLAGADPTLFQGAAYVLTPTAASTAEAFERLSAFLRLLGARVLAVDPETHDRLVAIVSHLPHIVASSLMSHAAAAAQADPGLMSLAGGGFRDVTRVAASSAGLWEGILRENRAAVMSSLDGFIRVVGGFREALGAGDWPRVLALLEEGRAATGLIPQKAVGAPIVEVVVPVLDRPGSLAAVTTALGGAGINIEDVAMRHAEGGDRGALVVAVAGREVAERAQEVLAARGMASHLEPR